MPEFFETRMGQTFYARDVPTIAKALVEIAAALNALTEIATLALAAGAAEKMKGEDA